MTYDKRHSILILPHWRIEGGAGYYIRDLIASLRPVGTVQVAGPYASEYDETPNKSVYLDKLTLQSLPTYEGIRFSATIYHIMISALRAIYLLAMPRRTRFKGSIDSLILTSSVQAMAVPIAHRMFPGCRIAVLVQENVCLSRGLGRLTRFFLRRADVVVSITETWARHARDNGFDPVVLPNSYDQGYAAPELNRDPAIESDLLYVGGGAKIKGFENLVAVLPDLLAVPERRVVCLGHYNEVALKSLVQIRNVAHPDAQLHIAGLVADIRPYLRGTKLLLLPIGSPHFCRPAIEAGLFGKTFVIPNFHELGDFAVNGENCVTYEATRPAELKNLIYTLLQDVDTRRSLEKGNKQLAERFGANQTQLFDAFLIRLFNIEISAMSASLEKEARR